VNLSAKRSMFFEHAALIVFYPFYQPIQRKESLFRINLNKTTIRLFVKLNNSIFSNLNPKTMKTKILLLVAVFAITFSAVSFAQERQYQSGSEWTVSFVQIKNGMSRDYLNSLKTTWKAVQDEGIKQGLILSYKVLEGNASNPDDWQIMLMVEYKNLASMEGNEAKWDAIQMKVVGNEEDQKKLRDMRVNMRTMYGTKLMREIVFK